MSPITSFVLGLFMGGGVGVFTMAMLYMARGAEPEASNPDRERIDLLQVQRLMLVPTHTDPYWAVTDTRTGKLVGGVGVTARAALDEARKALEAKANG
jgi:hypothetical protein